MAEETSFPSHCRAVLVDGEEDGEVVVDRGRSGGRPHPRERPFIGDLAVSCEASKAEYPTLNISGSAIRSTLRFAPSATADAARPVFPSTVTGSIRIARGRFSRPLLDVSPERVLEVRQLPVEVSFEEPLDAR